MKKGDRMEEKQCKACGEVKPLDEFYSQKKSSKKLGDYIYYNPRCKDCVILKAEEWRLGNPEKYNALKRKWVKENRKKYLALRRSYDYSEYRTNWRRENKDKLKQYRVKREKTKTHNISQTEWIACKEYFNNTCAYCGMTEEDHKSINNQQLHREHVIEEGRNDLKNCIPSCKHCNSSKHIYSLNNWYNKENEVYTRERYLKIYQWLRYDVKKYIERKPS